MLYIKLKKEVKRFCSLLLLMCFAQSILGQIVNKEGVKLKPYVGLSMPSDNFKSFSKSGIVYGITIDKFLTDRFALGVDINTQSTNYSNPFDFSNITSPYTINDEVSGNWHTTAFTFGPTYQLGNSKFNAEFYSKAGMLYIKTVNGVYNFQTPTETKSIFDLPEQERTSFAITSGVRFNFNVSDRLYVFLNPQYVYSTADIQYCDCGVSELSNPDNILEVLPVKKTFNPSYLNINAGLSFSLGGKSNPKKTKETELVSKEEINICEASILKQPYNGETFFAESGKVPEFKWINHSKPKALSYDFELYYGDKLIFEKNIKIDSFKFTKKMTEDFYGIKEAREYSWRVRTNYEDCEITTTDYNYFVIESRQTSSRSNCNLEITVDEIYCDEPAYTDTGMVKYRGTFTVSNNTPSLPGVLVPHPNALGTVQLFGTNIVGSSLSFSQGSITSPCSATPMQNTPYGLALPANSSATYCFDLEVPYGTTSIKFYANMNTYDGGELPAECPDDVSVTLPVCVCDSCDFWDFTDQHYSYTYDSANNNPYISHSILQSFKLPNTAPIRRMRADVVYVRHKVNTPKCKSCTTEVKDMGLFSTVNAKPKDLLANPLDWLYNNEGVAVSDINTDGFTNVLNWNARNPVTGVDFASRRHNFNMYINLPGDNSLECCKHEYEVWIRYTFEDINCVTCSTLIKYDLSKTSGSSTSNSGSGSFNTGVSNQQSSPLNFKN
ncbi:MAG TPA: hypothetical protein EYO76_00365 [Flavobacteriaceae bacterium]|nr:hypothetical protein [Flavobacteriaceae bacterium]